MCKNTVSVSIICNTYNHEDYIRDALDGFVMQRTNFRFEILIHDDASTDKTAEIIREYERKYPDILKPVYQTVNQYSRGGVGRFQYPRVKGKYVAICEGDDYWTDSFKLQKQYDIMESHPEIDLCAHAAVKIDAKTKNVLDYVVPSKRDGILSTEQVIAGGGGYFATCSLFYRSELTRNIPLFRQMINFDYTLQVHGSLRGGVFYLAECMGVYRCNVPGSWTDRMRNDSYARIVHHQKIQRMFEQLNQDTNFQYEKVILEKMHRNEFNHLYSMGCYHEILDIEYADIFRTLPLINRIAVRVLVKIPLLAVIFKKINRIAVRTMEKIPLLEITFKKIKRQLKIWHM